MSSSRRTPAFGSLEDPLAKLRRAKHHLEAIERSLPPMVPGHAHGLTCQVQPGGREYRFYTGTLPFPELDELALAVGDCLFNLRAALDHLVYQLHVRHFRGKITPQVEKTSAFPIGQTGPPNWSRIKELSLKHQAIIKGLQPYLSRNDKWEFTRQALGTLDLLNNIDKHRRLHLTFRVPEAFPRPSFPKACGFDFHPNWQPLEAHTEVVRWTFSVYVPDDIGEQVKMNSYFFLTVSLDDGGVPVSVPILLRHLWEHTKRIIRRFERDFPATTFPALPIRSGHVSASP